MNCRSKRKQSVHDSLYSTQMTCRRRVRRSFFLSRVRHNMPFGACTSCTLLGISSLLSLSFRSSPRPSLHPDVAPSFLPSPLILPLRLRREAGWRGETRPRPLAASIWARTHVDAYPRPWHTRLPQHLPVFLHSVLRPPYNTC